MKTAKNIAFVLLLNIMTVGCKNAFSGRADEVQRTPSWKYARPVPESRIQPGDKVYIFTNIFPDPFDGLFLVDKNGKVSPRFCGSPVKIGGHTEVEASTLVREHACRNDVYIERSNVKVFVVRAERLKAESNQNGQQAAPSNGG